MQAGERIVLRERAHPFRGAVNVRVITLGIARIGVLNADDRVRYSGNEIVFRRYVVADWLWRRQNSQQENDSRIQERFGSANSHVCNRACPPPIALT